MLDDRTLRYVAAVARAGSLRGAAREMGVAPSAVQRTLAAAERRVGWPLFERGPEGARVTDAGRVVVRHAQEKEDLDALLAARLGEVTSAARGAVAVAVGYGFVEEFTTQVLAPFMRDHPGVAVSLVTGGTSRVGELVLDDAVDLAIALHPARDRLLAIVSTLPQPVGLACAPDHPLAGADVVRPTDLQGERFAVLPDGFGLRALHDDFVRAHGIDAVVVMVSDSQPGIMAAISAGEGVALLPPITVARWRAAGRLNLVPVDDSHLQGVRAAVLTRAGRRLSPAATELRSRCAAWFRTPPVLP